MQSASTGGTSTIGLVSFSNLADPSTQASIRTTLKNVAGVYAFQSVSTGEIVYVGSTTNLAKRFSSHITGTASNINLQRAFTKYGIPDYNFIVLERYDFDWDLSTSENRDLLLALEQKYFLLHQHAETKKPRYNICPNAASSLGFTHSPETKELLSKNRKGSLNPMFGKQLSPEFLAQQTRDKTGVNNPVYGTTWSQDKREFFSHRIYVFSAETKELLTSYLGLKVAKKDLHMGHDTLKKYIASGKPYKGRIYSYSASLSEQ